MFRWPGVPSPYSREDELADFAELICWERGSMSITSLAQAIGRLAENDYSAGVPEEEDFAEYIEGAFQEIGRRQRACNGGYPFEVAYKGNVISTIHVNFNCKHLIYKYLLLATRLNMKENRSQGEIDGTKILEYLSAGVAKEYLGSRAESLVFGTAEGDTDFPGKVNCLCQRLEEGGGYLKTKGRAPRKKDDKLDIVAWKPFSDRREGKLIAFGQCKTGTSWRSDTSQLQPHAFCGKWFNSQPVLTPLRMFFVSEALSIVDWREQAFNAGLLFDRCRLVDYSNRIDDALLRKIEVWTRAAANATGLPSPLA